MRITEEYRALRAPNPQFGLLRALLAMPATHKSWSARIEEVADWGYRPKGMTNKIE